MSETCDSCRFWYGVIDALRWSGVRFEQCRRYPPVIRTHSHRKDDWGHASFPATPAKAWCGEFAPKAPTP